jgi:PII-like signaling protein
VNEDGLKLTTYFGERDRLGSRFLADAFVEIYARHRLQISLVMRGVEGFGAKHHLHTDCLLTLSEDLPLVAVAVDTRTRIETALHEIQDIRFDGLVTLERARILTGPLQVVELPEASHEATKLTVYLGRHDRIDGQPAHKALVELLHERGIAGATVLLGVDGTAYGERQRARFTGRNPDVPRMVMSIGDGHRIASLLPELGALLPRPLATLERVRVCKRDGLKLAEPHEVADTDASGLRVWQKLMVYAGEQSHHRGHQLNGELVRALRRAGAAGATSLPRHLRLPRRPPAPRRQLLAAPTGTRPHRHRRHPRLDPRLVRHRRRVHRGDRPGHQRDGPGLPRHRAATQTRRAATRRATR